MRYTSPEIISSPELINAFFCAFKPFILLGGVSLFLNKYIFGYGTVAKRTRCTFCDFRVKAIGYEKLKMAV